MFAVGEEPLSRKKLKIGDIEGEDCSALTGRICELLNIVPTDVAESACMDRIETKPA